MKWQGVVKRVMLYQISDGTVSVGGEMILSHIDFEVRGNEKIGIVGKNGAGKTTLLRLIAGELSLDRDDRRKGSGISSSRQLTIGMLSQQAFEDETRTVEEELFSSCPARDTFDRERFDYEREYDTLFTGFGFPKEDKKKKLNQFSGGERTKIAFIRLLLQKPDLLLLDEPTNHLDLETVQWLESYMRQYPKGAVIVSHDRFFLDQTVDVIYELSGKQLKRFSGNYTRYREEKVRQLKQQEKAYERQQEEIKRLEGLVERFKHKPKKAAFARSKRKIIERMEPVEKPDGEEISMFLRNIDPAVPGSKWVFTCEHLKIGYAHPLLELTMRIKRGQKIGLLGANGAGKTTFLKTIAGYLPALEGSFFLGNQVTMGYFYQQSAAIQSEKTVVDYVKDLFPAFTDQEARSMLGAYLFRGRDGAKKVSSLSGGERSRLVLACLLESHPNFLILDEPTNHMDIQSRERLEAAFRAYTGTILFVSHDRYFIRQVADSVLVFEGQSALYYPFGYEHYLERRKREEEGIPMGARIRAEEQALIAGLRAVPRAERHSLREIPEEEAYRDWKIRLAREELKKQEKILELLEERIREKKEAYEGSQEFWGSCDPEGWKTGLPDLCREHQEAWERWHTACMEWFDTAFDEGF